MLARRLIKRLQGKKRITRENVNYARATQILQNAIQQGVVSVDVQHKSLTSIARYRGKQTPPKDALEMLCTQFKPYFFAPANEQTRFLGKYEVYRGKHGPEIHYLDLFYQIRDSLSKTQKWEPRRKGRIIFRKSQ